MELVIKIPEEYYKAIKEIPVEQSSADMLIIRTGTPLPEGHGDLIDVTQIAGDGSWDISDRLEQTPIVIEADKA